MSDGEAADTERTGTMTSRYIIRRNNSDLVLGREFLDSPLVWVDAPFASVWNSEKDAVDAARSYGFIDYFTVATI